MNDFYVWTTTERNREKENKYNKTSFMWPEFFVYGNKFFKLDFYLFFYRNKSMA